jgi:oxygen-dependent protoporphyrinogen oxidase
MQRLIAALSKSLPAESVVKSAAVSEAKRSGDQWVVSFRSGPPAKFDAIILATPAPISAALLKNEDPQLSSLLGRIPHAGCSVALVGIRRDQVSHALDGFGFVVPAMERRRIIACSLASVKFPGRAPDRKVLLRVFVGGALQPELAELPDESIRQLVLEELDELIGLRGEPEFFDVARWLGAMPQYHVGHLELVRQIEERAAAIPNFALAGNAYRGVGIPFCVQSGERAAEAIMRSLGAVGDTTSPNSAPAPDSVVASENSR